MHIHVATKKSAMLKFIHFLLLVLVYCCALNGVADSSGPVDKATGVSSTTAANSLSKETVDDQVGLILNKRSMFSGISPAMKATPNIASALNPVDLETARQFCQQLGVAPYSRWFPSENEPDGLVLDRQGSAPVMNGAQDIVPLDEELRDPAKLCKALLLLTSGGKVVQSKRNLGQNKKSKRALFFFGNDKDESGENSESLSKKLDFLFGHEHIRFKRNNATGSNSFLVRLYVPASTSKPSLLQHLSRLGTTASFTTTSGATLSPTFATPLLSNRLNPSASSALPRLTSLAPFAVSPSPLPSISGSGYPTQLRPQHRPIIGRLLMLHRPFEPAQKGTASSSWIVFDDENSQTVVPANTEFSNAEPIRFVKKNPFEKEGIRFKRRAAATAVSSFEVNYPFANEGIRFKKSSPFADERIRYKKAPFDEEGIRYKKSSPFADEGIRYKKSPFDADEEGIRYKKSSPFAAEGIRFKKSPFDAEGIRYKKAPFDEEGIRYKKSSPFADEGIRYKKSPFDADEEGIRYKKSSPFAAEGIRFKKSPFDDAEGIRY